MKLGGLNPFSLTDFPGQVAAVVFTQGCNFRCPFCHNSKLIPLRPSPKQLVPVETFFDFLTKRIGLLDAVVISGGEPTLQPDLFEFIIRIHALGFQIKLDTNGSHPEMLEKLVEKSLIDYIAMDLKAPPKKLEILTGVPVNSGKLDRSIALISTCGMVHEFRTTYVKPLLTDDDLAAIKSRIPKESPHKIQTFVAQYALDPSLRSHLHPSRSAPL